MKLLTSTIELIKPLPERYNKVIADAKESGNEKRIRAANNLQLNVDAMNMVLKASEKWEKKITFFKRREVYIVPKSDVGLIRNARAYLGK